VLIVKPSPRAGPHEYGAFSHFHIAYLHFEIADMRHMCRVTGSLTLKASGQTAARDNVRAFRRGVDWDFHLGFPQVFAHLEELTRLCGARRGSIGAFIEDQNSGTILLQQALRRQVPAHAIDSKLTAMGKDERAISVSGYVHRELVKYTKRTFEKTVIYKRHSRNHLLDQVESFRVGDRDSNREDDLLDAFCYGIALALGNNEGF
jgi:hypothetical protein